MNIRKPTDYSPLFAALKALMHQEFPQMELYYRIGALISTRIEKGASVASAEYLQAQYPDIPGFSPRNVRRMRDFYRMYESTPEIIADALTVGWTHNVIIMETCENEAERSWYLRAVKQFGWSKTELLDRITDGAHEDIILGAADDLRYTESEPFDLEEAYNEDIVCLPRHHLPQLGGRIYYEESVALRRIQDRLRSNQPVGKRQPGVLLDIPHAVQAWHRLLRQNSDPVYERCLRQSRPADQYG